MDRRTFLAGTLATAGAVALPARAEAGSRSHRTYRYEFLPDTTYRQGMNLTGLHAKDPHDGFVGILDFGNRHAVPRHICAQWNSNYSLQGAPLERYRPGDLRVSADDPAWAGDPRLGLPVGAPYLTSGGLGYACETKRVVRTPEGGLLIEVYGRPDAAIGVTNNPTLRIGAGPVAPFFDDPHPIRARLADLVSFTYGLDVRLNFLQNRTEPASAYNPENMSGHLTSHLNIVNTNEQSPDYQRYLIYGMPLCDYRYPSNEVPPFYSVDAHHGGGTLQYNNTDPGADFWTGDARDGHWHHLSRDLLPPILTGLDRAKSSGYLLDTQVADLEVGYVDFSWEIGGPLGHFGAFDGSAEVRNVYADVVSHARPS